MMQLEMHIPAPCPKYMPEATAAVLAMLQEKKHFGVTWDDWPRGFALRSRISDLRKKGYRITTINETLEGGAIRARYILL
jgi:hypothetical protein